MLGYWRPHSEFQSWLQKQVFARMATHRPAIELHAVLLEKVFTLDLDRAKPIVAELYSPTGRPARFQPEILRALFVAAHLKTGVVELLKRLAAEEILALACGFEPGQSPAVGSFYDLMTRFYPTGSNPKRLRKPRVKSAKGTKLKAGQKLEPKHPGIVERIVKMYLRGRRLTKRPERTLQRIFAECAVMPSARLELLGNVDNLVIAGDGAPLRTGASPFGRKVCQCKERGIFRCHCPRRYSDPEANFGWDSYHEQFFYGHTLYSLTSARSHNDLPLLLRLVQASRHDSITFLFAFSEFRELYPQFRVSKVLLDSAHDAQPLYELLYREEIEPFIDLNPRHHNRTYSGPIAYDEAGVPICPAGLKMKCWGFNRKRVRTKWRCPFYNKLERCPRKDDCSPSPYGRVVYTKPQWDVRTFTPVPRGSEAWKKVFAGRTSVERTFKRLLVDYRIEEARLRGKGRWFFRVTLAAMNQHLDAQVAKAGRLLSDKLACISIAA